VEKSGCAANPRKPKAKRASLNAQVRRRGILFFRAECLCCNKESLIFNPFVILLKHAGDERLQPKAGFFTKPLRREVLGLK